MLLALAICMIAVSGIRAQRTPRMIDGPRGPIGFYEYLPPSYAEGKNLHPLIIFLHGIGEKGTGSPEDLEKINCCGLPRYIDEGHPMRFTWDGKTEEFVVLYPQLYSRYGTWENYYIDAMLEYAHKNLRVDTNRIFLTGLSLGGGGSWVYPASSLSNARKLAGIVPVVSPCFMTNGCNIANANLPVLAIHAQDDDKASPLCTINAIKGINDCGAAAQPNLIMYQNGGHYVWVKRAYDTEYNYFNPNIYEWMLAQDRRKAPNVKPMVSLTPDTVINSNSPDILLDASGSSDPDGRIVRYVWQKVSGPPYGILAREGDAVCRVSGLTHPGVYTFEVRVIDDRAEWSTGRVRVRVVDGALLN